MAEGFGYRELSLAKHSVTARLPFSRFCAAKHSPPSTASPFCHPSPRTLPRALGQVSRMLLQAPWSKGQRRSPNPEERRPHPHNCKGLPISNFHFIFPFAIKTKPRMEPQEKSGRGRAKGRSQEKCAQLLSKTKVLRDLGEILSMVL